MKNKRLAFFTIILAALSVIFFVVYQSYKEYRTTSEIYSQVLIFRPHGEAKNFLTDCLSHDRKLLISSESNIFFTSQGKSWQEASVFNLQQIQSNTWRDFLQTNSIASNFPSNLPFGCEYTLVNLKNYKSVPSSDCPIVMLSRIGFNQTGNQALVLVSQSCGQDISLTLFLLDLVNGHWQVTNAVSPPISFTY
jgi:hypothetical protein